MIVAASLLAGIGSQWFGHWLWIAGVPPLLFGMWLESKTSDGLLTVRFPGTRRRSAALAVAGACLLAIRVFVGSRLSSGLNATMLVSGAGIAIAGAWTLLWHAAATYAGDKIVRLSDEDW